MTLTDKELVDELSRRLAVSASACEAVISHPDLLRHCVSLNWNKMERDYAKSRLLSES